MASQFYGPTEKNIASGLLIFSERPIVLFSVVFIFEVPNQSSCLNKLDFR